MPDPAWSACPLVRSRWPLSTTPIAHRLLRGFIALYLLWLKAQRGRQVLLTQSTGNTGLD